MEKDYDHYQRKEIISIKMKKAQKQKLKDAIIILNDIVKVRLAPSPIHGIGVFAMRKMKVGEQIYADSIPHAFDIPYKMFKELRSEVRDIILSHWPQINGSHFLYPVTKMSAFLNHSDDANYDAKEDKLLADVNEGDELTENYKTLPNWEKVFKWLK
jgi:hypothetical protein